MNSSNTIRSTFLTLLTLVSVNAWALESGPKVGDKAEAFVVSDITGAHKGDSVCYRCEYGDAPVVTIFTRELDGPVWNAIKDLDMKVGKSKSLKGFVVYLSDDKGMAASDLAALAEKHKIKNVPLTTTDAKGPKSYMLSAEAGVTVVMWEKGEVMMKHAYGDHEFCSECHKMVISEVTKLDN